MERRELRQPLRPAGFVCVAAEAIVEAGEQILADKNAGFCSDGCLQADHNARIGLPPCQFARLASYGHFKKCLGLILYGESALKRSRNSLEAGSVDEIGKVNPPGNIT